MKYKITTEEGDYEPGSDGTVLKNNLGITCPDDAFEAESELLEALYIHVFENLQTLTKLDFKQLQEWHRNWLQPIYLWAGQLRTVDMSKGDFRFAAAKFLTQQIKPFEANFLSKYDEVEGYSQSELVSFLAAMHAEFILIHPFREGNGRMSRLLNDVFATKAGYQPLDYQLWHTHRDYYFSSIQAAVTGDYSYLERLVSDVFVKESSEGG